MSGDMLIVSVVTLDMSGSPDSTRTMERSNRSKFCNMTNENVTKNFGDTLSLLMKQKNLSARELAKAINEPQKTVNDWLTHKTRIPRDPMALKKLSDLFGISVYFLLFGHDDPKSLMEAFLEKTEIHTGLYEISIKKVKPRKD